MKRYGIGRDETNNIVIDHPSVSRHHAELAETMPGHYTLTDLGSKFGTGGQGPPGGRGQRRIARGNRVRLGNYVRSVDSLLDAAMIRSPEQQRLHRAPTTVITPRRTPAPNMALIATLLGIGILCGGVFVLFQ